ncbi:adenylate/guanylate cyclase domain-containing protein [Niabella hirudinis]|uniref:adenylate/guanylate cyclase domain-containing protein n=1 Tax=Niabella hirudinis TaxID=1285929 RepID=UPI003EBF9B65
MLSKRILYFRLKMLLTLSMIWILFGFLFLFNILEIEKQLLSNRSPAIFCFTFAVMGLVIASALTFYLKAAFRKYPLWLAFLLKLALAFGLFVLVAFSMLAAYFVFGYHGSLPQFATRFFRDVFFTKGFLILMADLGLLTLISLVLLEVTDKYGPGGFWSMMRGEYHRPRKERRIFIFLDINNATTIAERIGHERYFLLLKDFFSDITNPVLANGGEIYQYVGDEVVLSWKESPENKIYALRFIRQTFYILKRRERYYTRQYTAAPTFKAGIHSGEVTSGLVGIVKKDLVYSGDTLNTAARLRGKCHELQQSFILSGGFMNDFHQPFAYKITGIGEMELKGRAEKERLFSLEFE